MACWKTFIQHLSSQVLADHLFVCFYWYFDKLSLVKSSNSMSLDGLDAIILIFSFLQRNCQIQEVTLAEATCKC